MKILILLGLVVAAFGGGFYLGLEYHKNALRTDPQEFEALLKDEEFQKMMTDEMKKKAKDKANRIWNILVEDF